MEYEEYKAICAKCSAHGGPAKLCKGCTVMAELKAEAYRLIMQLSPSERDRLLSEWEKKVASRSQADQSTLQEAI